MRPARWQTVEPTRLDAAVAWVNEAVQFGKGRIFGGAPAEGFLIATAAMNHVVWGVSNVLWTTRVANGAPLPPIDAEAALEAQAGLCGHSAVTYAAIVGRFGLPVRSAQFYWDSRFGARSHIACEVNYRGAWRYFDPTWGAFYHQGGEVLGIEEARAGGGELLRDQTLLFNLLDEGWGDLRYLTDAATKLDIGHFQF